MHGRVIRRLKSMDSELKKGQGDATRKPECSWKRSGRIQVRDKLGVKNSTESSMKTVPHRLVNLSAWSPVGGTA